VLHRTIRSITTLCLVLSPAVLVGCDRDDDIDEPRSAGQLADDEEADDDERDAHAGRGRHHRSLADKLCDAVDCSDAQREQITGIVAGAKGERPSPETFASANAALAASWKDADFDAADLEAWRDAVHDDGRPRLSAQTVVAVHAVLDAKQRGMVADLVETRGAGKLFGHHGGGKRHGKGHKGEAKAGDGHKGPQHAVAKLCDRVSCTDAQRTAIGEALAAGRPERARDEAADRALATAFRGEALAVADVEGYLAIVEAARTKEMAARDASAVAIHRALTAEQRATLAADIAEHGPFGIIGAGRGHHGKRGKDGGRGSKRGPAPADGELPA
jgi:Spy/CpxP family protein refolding chaperone